MAEHPAYSITPAQILDPYPDHPVPHPGDRNPTQTTPTIEPTPLNRITAVAADLDLDDLEQLTQALPELDPLPFAASLELDEPPGFVSPWASLLLALTGFIVLGAVALAADVLATVILAAWLLWAVCSAALVAAECSSIQSETGNWALRNGGAPTLPRREQMP